LGSAREKPYSKPRTASSDRARVDDLVVRLAGAEVVERDVVLLGGLVDDRRVALGEGAAHAVLARQPDREAVVQQGGEGEVLGGSPVDALARLDGDFRPSTTRRTVLWASMRSGMAVMVTELPQPGERHGGVAPALLTLGQGQPRPLAVEPVGLVGLVGLAASNSASRKVSNSATQLVDVVAGDDTLGDQRRA
jgi:hypothetical protein